MGVIDREDMLELTRRMTVKRNCFSRIAGAYMDRDGFVDGTFNTHFLKLSPAEQTEKLKVAKAIPFAETNVEMREYPFQGEDKTSGSFWQLLMGLKQCELKNDALLDVFYEEVGEQFTFDRDYGIFFFYGNYDIPLKASDKERLWESEEVYSFLICAICPIDREYVPESPICGFLFPAFKERSGNEDWIDLFEAKDGSGKFLKEMLFGRRK